MPRSIEELFDRQIGRWTVARQTRREADDCNRPEFLAHHVRLDSADNTHSALTLNAGTLLIEVVTATTEANVRARFPDESVAQTIYH